MGSKSSSLKKRHAWPEGAWNWPIKVSHKHAVRCGEMIWVGGQVDLSPDGIVNNPADLPTQTRKVMHHFDRALRELDCDLEDVAWLLCFYVNDGSLDEQDFLTMVGACLPANARVAVNAVPVPALAYPGLAVEIEGYAMRRLDGQRTEKFVADHTRSQTLPKPFCEAVRSGKMIFVSGQYPYAENAKVSAPGNSVSQTRQVMAQIEQLLNQFGAGFDDVVKINRWYAGNVGVEDFEPAALACASFFPDPGPAATGIPLPVHADPEVAIKISVVAMLGEDGQHLPRTHSWPESLWDWHTHLPYQHGVNCAGMIFLGGQVSLNKQGRATYPDDLSAQTHQAMTHIGTILNDLGADYSDVCKILAVYCARDDAQRLHENLSIRSSYFAEPGPASTGVPLPALAYDSMVIEIDTFAMVDESD